MASEAQHRYRVKVLREVSNGAGNGTNRYPMVTTVIAPNAAAACRKGVEQLRAEGYDGVYRWPEAENEADGHDAIRMSW